MEENLLGHLLKANDPATERAVADRLAADPAAARDLAGLRAALRPLEADRDEPDPPADLWVRTLGRVAEHVVATEGPVGPREPSRTEELLRRAALSGPAPVRPTVRPAPPPSDATPPTTGRWNVIAVIGLSLSLLALALPAVIHVRARAHQTVCQDSMSQFYRAAAGYTDQNDGQFPQVPDGEPAAVAAEALKRAGYLAADVRFACPSAPPDAAAPVALATYAYTLGFRDESGRLRGLDRGPGHGTLPILADAPARVGGTTVPINHRRGQNVLFADGHVQFYTVSAAGPDGDDIFCNQAGHVAAGLFKQDAALGRPEERP